MIREFYSDHRRAISLGMSAFAGLLTVLYFVRPDLAAGAAIIGTWALPVALWAMGNWERVETIGAGLLSVPGRVWSHAERVSISAEMQGHINGARRKMLEELEGALPHPVRVKFVRKPGDLTELHEGEIVVVLGNHKRRAENLARATLAYTTADLIRPARPYVDPKVMRSIDHSVTKRILRESDTGALDFFLNSIWADEITRTPDLQGVAHEVETIERHGLLTRVLLTEFLELGRRFYPEFPPPGIFDATRGLLGHLYRIATKRPDESLGDGLMFRTSFLSVGVVLVADKDMAAKAGPRAYVWRCLEDIRKGCHAVYLLARGSNASLIPEVLGGLRGHGRVMDIGDPTTYQMYSETGRVTVTCVRILADQRGYGAAVITLDDVARTAR